MIEPKFIDLKKLVSEKDHILLWWNNIVVPLLNKSTINIKNANKINHSHSIKTRMTVDEYINISTYLYSYRNLALKSFYNIILNNISIKDNYTNINNYIINIYHYNGNDNEDKIEYNFNELASFKLEYFSNIKKMKKKEKKSVPIVTILEVLLPTTLFCNPPYNSFLSSLAFMSVNDKLNNNLIDLYYFNSFHYDLLLFFMQDNNIDNIFESQKKDICFDDLMTELNYYGINDFIKISSVVDGNIELLYNYK